MCVEPLAQSVEQQPFKLWVVGSIPTRLTRLRLRGLNFEVLIRLRLARPVIIRSGVYPEFVEEPGSQSFKDQGHQEINFL